MEKFIYSAKVIKVVDGDTVKLEIDLGFHITWSTNCRLSGINADELKDRNPLLKEAAQIAKKYLETILPEGEIVTIKSKSLDKYKRPIAEIITKNGINVNEDLIKSGHAKLY